MNLAEQLDLVEAQIRQVNETFNQEEPINEPITITLADNRVAKTYITTDEILNVILDTLIVHQSELDDYWCEASLPQPIEDELLFRVNVTKQGFDNIKAVIGDNMYLLKAEKREDARTLKRKERPLPPKWAIVDDETKPIPAYMYLGPQTEDAEAAMVNGAAIPYKKIKVKNHPQQNVTIGRIGI